MNERIAHYEIEIKEYQIKADQDTREFEQLRNELLNVQEEKVRQEKQFNETTETLKDELQRLQNELKSQGNLNTLIIFYVCFCRKQDSSNVGRQGIETSTRNRRTQN